MFIARKEKVLSLMVLTGSKPVFWIHEQQILVITTNIAMR